MLKPTYIATSELSYVGSGSPSNQNSETNAIVPSTDLPDLVMSSDVVERAMQKLNLQPNLAVVGGISVKSSPHSNLVPISVGLKDPLQAVAVANALADSAVTEYKIIAARQYDEVVKELQGQLMTERDAARVNDARLQHALQTDYSVGSNDSLNTIAKHLDDLESERGAAYATYVADSAAASAQVPDSGGQRRGLTSAIHEQILANDPTYQALKSLQSKDKAALVAMKSGYTSSFKAIPGLEEQVQGESAAVARARNAAIAEHPGNSATYAQIVLNQHNAAALAAGDAARVAAIDQSIAAAKARLADLPGLGVAANMYRLQRDTASAAYQQLETRYQQTLADRAQATALGAVFVLDRARAAYPKTPRVVTATIIAMLILSLAIGVAFLAEIVDPRVRTAADIEDLYGTPRIGSV
jgi:capsular polysaccharide biosynthesis protein